MVQSVNIYLLPAIYIFTAKIYIIACNIGDPVSIPDSKRSPGEGNGNPPQHSCLGNHMDRGTWGVIVHGVAQSQIRLGN